MKIRRATSTVLSSPEEVESILLERLPEAARASFLTPLAPALLGEESHRISPLALSQAAALIRQAGQEKMRILIFGDYDCDGVTSTAILWETLYELGIEAKPFLPHREKHGYGISVAVLEEIWEEYQPELLVTVDNGIVAHEAFRWLKEKGVQTILTDHHQQSDTLPDADVIVHSSLLSGAGVAWYLAHELSPEIAQKELDFAVLGTLSDQVPLLHANRSIAVYGLQALRATHRISLRALAKKAKLSLDKADENTVHYGFAPRINALGRISHALDALRALLSRQPARMEQLLSQMEETNTERQRLTNEAYLELSAHLQTSLDDPISLAVGSYPEGIIGLLASKLVDTYHKPAMVISIANETPKASCRSVEGVNIIEFLRSLPPDLFTSLGGHPGAAGFSLEQGALQRFLEVAKSSAREQISPEHIEKVIDVVGELEWQVIRSDLLDVLDRFSPYGAANESPIFSLGNVEVVDSQPVGKEGMHKKISIRHPDTKQTLSLICFAYQRRGIVCDEIREPFVKLKRSTYKPGLIDIELVAARTNSVAE